MLTALTQCFERLIKHTLCELNGLSQAPHLCGLRRQVSPKVFQYLLSSVGSACVGQYFEDLPDHPVTSTLEVRISHVPS